jgi:hypothetical protein
MLIAIRAEVERADHWREQFKTHNDFFKSQGVSLAYMGALSEDKVLGVLRLIIQMNLSGYLTIRLPLRQWKPTESLVVLNCFCLTKHLCLNCQTLPCIEN